MQNLPSMKTIIILLIGLALSIKIQAQAYQYHPFPMDSVRWNMKMISYQQWGLTLGYPYYHSYSISGDTTINNVQYSIVYYNTTPIGGIREDSTKKVWYYNWGHPSVCPSSASLDTVLTIGTESLLFDFNLHIGSGFSHPVMHRIDGNGLLSVGNAYSEAIGADSILLLDGTYRKLLHIKTSYPVDSQVFGSIDTFVFDSYWVEGIGSMGRQNTSLLGLSVPSSINNDKYHNGLFGVYTVSTPGSSPPSCKAYIHCFIDKGTQLLGANNLAVCDTIVASNKMKEQDVEIVLFPNPLHHQSTIAVLGIDCEELSIQILDGTGAIVREERVYGSTEITLKRKDLDSGIYFYRLWADNRPIGSGKFVVQP